MPIKGYIAGRPVSRWEAETDNIDIDYRNLDGHGLGPCSCIEECQTGRKGCALKILLCVVLFFIGIFVGYLIRRNIHEQLSPQAPLCPAALIVAPKIQDYNKTLAEIIKKRLDYLPNYNQSLKDFPSNINLAGMPLTNKHLVFTKKWLEMFDFDSVRMKSYTVDLEYPVLVSETLSYVAIEENGTEIFHSHSNITQDHREYLAFCAYSASKTVKGKLVYVNYGSVEDFRLLESKGVLVNNSIVIVRYGKVHPGSKVKHAEERGALGVILYSDPYDFADKQSSASPGTWWLPDWAIQSSHVRAGLTSQPFDMYSNTDSVCVSSDQNSSYPKIPVHPISYRDAGELLKNLAGELVPIAWKGSLPVEYRAGPGFQGDAENRTVKLSVSNKSVKRDIHNLIAVIHGHYERDQYVIVGAHHDSWTFGAVDAGSGHAVLVELAKSFARLRKTGWQPRRTMIFAFWDASKYGQIGSFKWVQENARQLTAGAVAYINLDSLVRGDYSFYAESSPMLAELILEAAQSVACANTELGPGMSVYDMWARKFPSQDTNPTSPIPKVPFLSGDSDHVPFLYLLGVPSISPAYTYNLNAFPNLPNYPAYSTLDDTYDYLLRYIDPELHLHATVSKVIAEVTMRLADSALLPLSVKRLEDLMEEGWDSLQRFAGDFETMDFSLESLRIEINHFKTVAENFTASVQSINISKARESDIQTINDQLLRLSRAFIIDKGLPGTPEYRHSLVSPHPENLNKHMVFPGIVRALLKPSSDHKWQEVEEQLNILLTSLRYAQNIMQNSLIS